MGTKVKTQANAPVARGAGSAKTEAVASSQLPAERRRVAVIALPESS